MDGGRSSAQQSSSSFDATMLQDFLVNGRLVELLTIIRGLPLSPEVAMEVRDRVLDYAQSSTDDERTAIIAAIKEQLDINDAPPPTTPSQATPQPTPAQPAPVSTFGMTRPAPKFTPANVRQNEATTPRPIKTPANAPTTASDGQAKKLAVNPADDTPSQVAAPAASATQPTSAPPSKPVEPPTPTSPPPSTPPRDANQTASPGPQTQSAPASDRKSVV